MLRFRADKARISIIEDEVITSGRAGLEFVFEFSDDWDGLEKIAVCRCGEVARNVPFLLDKRNIFPHECFDASNIGEPVSIGICGADTEGNIVIPTIYANLGFLAPGANPAGSKDPPPTPGEIAAILNAANEAKQIAQSVRDDAAAGEFMGAEGPGIEKIELVSTSGTNKTYRIYVENGHTYDYVVADGVSPTVSVEKVDGGTNVNITDGRGDHTFLVPDGVKGDKGDRGAQGVQGEQGIQGEKGDKGDTGDSGVYIGETEPTDPNVTVWIDTSGDSDDDLVATIQRAIEGVSYGS